jgi:hypothetical protein
MPCVVCSHPAAQTINRELVEHSTPVLKLADQHSLSRDSVNWHRRKHLPGAPLANPEAPPPSTYRVRAARLSVGTPRDTTTRARSRFLDTYAKSGNVSWAAKQAGIDRHTVYVWQEQDDTFAQAFREADLKATEALEREAWRRASEGIQEPVFQHGKLVGTIQRYSDNLLMFLLRARAPERYRDRVDVSVAPIIKSVAGFDPESVV